MRIINRIYTMATKSKRIEVVSPNIKCYGENVSFMQLLETVNSVKFQIRILQVFQTK